MAVSVSNRVASADNGGGASHTTGSFTPGANKLVLVSIFLYKSSGTILAPTVVGNGITYTEIAHCNTFSSGLDPCQTYLFRGLLGAPTAGGILITSVGADFVGAAVDEADGIDTSGINGAGAIVQSAFNQNNSGSTLTVTLGAFSDANNGTFGCVNSYGSSLKTVGTGFTELTDATDSPQSQWRADNDTSVDWSGLSVACGGVAIELKIAGASDTLMGQILT